MNHTLKVLDLFSGIGGFSLGLERTGGFETIAFCEIEPFCQKILKKHWPNVPIYDDVRALDGRTITADVICGGYPCQPFSVAGQRAGEADDRHLWPEMYRLIKSIRPRWVIAENVAGHVSMGLDAVLYDLEAANYRWWTFIIPACAVDAKHRRDRVWIVGDSQCMRELQPQGGEQDKRGRAGNTSEDVADAESEQTDRQRQRVLQPVTPQHCEDVSYSNGTQRERGRVSTGIHQKYPDTSEYCRWETEPAVGRVANGIPSRMDRLKSLGNAVVPQIPEIIGRAILESL
jgi:DNA (cytosine-5)-methyltransferase 1